MKNEDNCNYHCTKGTPTKGAEGKVERDTVEDCSFRFPRTLQDKQNEEIEVFLKTG